eukprot:2720630-Prymnesium_polylepis.1
MRVLASRAGAALLPAGLEAVAANADCAVVQDRSVVGARHHALRRKGREALILFLPLGTVRFKSPLLSDEIGRRTFGKFINQYAGRTKQTVHLTIRRRQTLRATLKISCTPALWWPRCHTRALGARR